MSDDNSIPNFFPTNSEQSTVTTAGDLPTNTNESKWRETVVRVLKSLPFAQQSLSVASTDQIKFRIEDENFDSHFEYVSFIEIGALNELRTQLAAAKEEIERLTKELETVDRANIIAERRLYGDSSDMMDASQEAAHYNWLDEQNEKLTEELRVAELQSENLSAVIRKMTRYAATRRPEVACEKILELGANANHLLVDSSPLRNAKLESNK